MTELKKWITTALLTLLLLPAMAQQKADTTYHFANAMLYAVFFDKII